jgi:hypothetical protein
MAIEIKKVFKKHLPSVRFVGKMYTDKDRVDGMFGKYWKDWYENGWFKILKNLPQIENIDIDAFGLMGIEYKNGVHQNFQYWIGIQMGFLMLIYQKGMLGFVGFMGVITLKKYTEKMHILN